MNSVAFLLTILAVLVALVSSQSCPSNDVYNKCKADNVDYEATTCGELQTKNATHYNQCLCYSSASGALCIAQCPDDPTAQAEHQVYVQNRTARCAAVNLDHANLPSPPPWQTFFEPTATANPTSTGSTPSPTSGTDDNNAASRLGISQCIVLFVAIILFIQ